MKQLPPTAPRGMAYMVVRTNHVVGGKILPVVISRRTKVLAEAQAEAARFDPRLSPAVVMVDDKVVFEDRS